MGPTSAVLERMRSFNNKRLMTAATAAVLAGNIIRKGYGQHWSVTEKGVGDVVSQVDLDAEKIIIRTLEHQDPDSSILSEERGESGLMRNGRWIVDPLDASNAYLYVAGKDKPSVMLAHESSERVVDLGVVYLPLTEEWFFAMKGVGAYCSKHHEPLKVEHGVTLNAAWIEMNCYADASKETVGFKKLHEALRSAKGARMVTSQPPHSAVAMRIIDGSCRLSAVIHDNNATQVKQAVWDVAAPKLIIEEAGGIVSNLIGEPYNMWRPEPFLITGCEDLSREIVELAIESRQADRT